MMQKKNRAFLKWAGGKYSLVENINAKLPSGNRLIEPFVGAGSVFLNTDFKRYLLNDINPDLINLYNFLKAQPDAVVHDAMQFFTDAHNNEATYYALREEFNQTSDEYYRAILFLYLNRHGYNGLCRYSLSGKFNVPFGRYKKPYFPEEEMLFFAQKSQKAVFTCLPFEKVFSRARRGNVIYIIYRKKVVPPVSLYILVAVIEDIFKENNTKCFTNNQRFVNEASYLM